MRDGLSVKPGSSECRLQTSMQRWRRPNVWLGAIIPALLLLFAVKGYALVLLKISACLSIYRVRRWLSLALPR